MATKTCRVCKLTSDDMELFVKCNTCTHGRQKLCLVCKRALNRQYYKDYPKRVAAMYGDTCWPRRSSQTLKNISPRTNRSGITKPRRS